MMVLRKQILPLVFGFVIALAAMGVDMAEAACVSGGQTRQLVASGQVVPLSTALKRAGVSGDVVKVNLCQQGGGYVYQVSILGPGGRLQTKTIPAR